VRVDGAPRVIEADTVVICAGKEANRSLFEALQRSGLEAHLIGGAKEAVELDAVRAADEGVRVAQSL
jgi:2,4-dienoyl-CoA reductase (NADPH2)